MSSGIITPPSPASDAPVAPPTECELIVQRRIEQTQRNVKGVDLAGGLIALAAGVLAYLLIVAAIDHWLVVGGLGFWGRVWLWAALVVAAGTYVVRRLLPPLVYRINPLFAAATIERSRPSLKNSLINFLLLRGRRREVALPVYQAMEHQAAADVTSVELEEAVERTHVIRLLYVLAAVLAVFSLYLVLSPKNPIRSAARVLWPWSGIEAPTRVTIRDVQPGDAVDFHGQTVAVSAELSGLRDGEPAMVIYSTADGQTVDQTVALTRPEGAYRYQCRLPPDSLGLQQDLSYHLAAGDCRTRRYRIEAQIAPTIVVDKALYHYPAYTGMADQTVQRRGDLRALEGTEVTVYATANAEIKPGTAEIDRGCTGRQGLRMTIDGRSAVGQLTLRLDPQDVSRPEYDSYQLRFADLQGRENRRPIRHRVEVIRDLPPDVQVVEPQKDEVSVAADGSLAVKVRAEDPDFALRRVILRAECRGKSLPIAPLLDRRKPAQAMPGEVSVAYAFQPGKLGLKAGDRVEYWAEAEDNKEPTAGKNVSARQWIAVVAPEQPPPPGGEQAADKTQTDDKAAGGGEQSDDKASGGEQAGDKGQTGGGKQSGDKASDGEQAGDKGDGGQQSGDKGQAGQQAGGGQQRGDKGQAGQRAGGGQRSGENASDRQQSAEAGRDKGQSQGNKQSPGQQQPAQGSEKSKERIDPEASPGDAMQEILDDRQESGRQPQAGKQGAGEKGRGEKGQGEKGESGKGQGDKGQGEKGEGEKAQGEKGQGEKSQGEKSEKGAGEKGGGEKGDDRQAAGQQPDARTPPKEKPGADTAGGEKSGSAAGGQQPNEPGGQQSDKQRPSGEQPAGEEAPPGAGRDVGNDAGSPAPQNDNQTREKKPGKPGESSGEGKGDMAQSPSTSKKQSDSQGDTAGDRSGGGEQGGGQRANQRGVGSPGKQTPADEGGSQSDEPGEGQIGSKAGDQATSKKSTDSAAKGKSDGAATGDRTGEGAGGKPSTDTTDAKPAGEAADGKATGGSAGGQQGGAGSPTVGVGGAQPGAKSAAVKLPEAVEPPPDEANLEYARRQTELALEHLREQLAKEKPAVLERLKWTKDDARRFLERWEAMRRAASEAGPAGEAARKRLEDALRSLGLRPHGTELRHDGVKEEQTQGLRDAGQFVPPPEWAEQLREYTRDVAGGER